MTTSLLQTLRNIEIFNGVPEEQLQWLVDMGNVRTFKAGAYVLKQGDAMQEMFILLKGLISFKLKQNGHFRELSQVVPGGISGALPYSRAKKAAGNGIAEEESTVLILEKVHFKEMISHHHELTTALVHIMTTRVREFTTTQQQNDKMAALGKLSAGLAHELNNPASAVVRSSSELEKKQAMLPAKLQNVFSLNISAEEMEVINKIVYDRAKPRVLSLEERTKTEDQLLDWLEEHNIKDDFEIAETFTDFSVTLNELEQIKAQVAEKDLAPVLSWIESALSIRKLVLEINDGGKRISQLINAIKSYSHMDKAPEKSALNIQDSINTTLTMLSHKLRDKNIHLEQRIQDGIPAVKAYPGSINQVWTNLIDNAIDAMEQEGVLEISVCQENDHLRIDVIDDGAGITEDEQLKIFDPFYTTKDIGKGTGLGLDIVNKIIQQHNGSIKVNSAPGRTAFTICLPLE